MEDLHRVDIKIPKEELKWLGIEAATLGISRRQLIADIIINNVRTIISIRKGVTRPTPDYISISTDEAVELGLDKEQVKQLMNEAIHNAGEFFNLGNKRSVAARNKSNKSKK